MSSQHFGQHSSQIFQFVAAVLLCSHDGWSQTTFQGMNYTPLSEHVLESAMSNQSLMLMNQVGVNTVALNVFWFQDSLTSTEIRPCFDDGCYSASTSSVANAIDFIHDLGMDVLLKPVVEVNKGNDSRLGLNPGENVGEWFSSYGNFLGTMADIAAQKDVAVLSIGTELNGVEGPENDERWKTLIDFARSKYAGDLVYAANHAPLDGIGGYENISWWNQLDYIGIDAYFHLADDTDGRLVPLGELSNAWTGHADRIERWRRDQKLEQRVIFTEVGYTSSVGAMNIPASGQPLGPVSNENALTNQAIAYEAMLSVMGNREWWNGAFGWNWSTDPLAGQLDDQPDNSFTPQNKPAQDVIAGHYGGVSLPPIPFDGLLASWESGTEGFADNPFDGASETTLRQSDIGATHGNQSLAVTIPEDGFNYFMTSDWNWIDPERFPGEGNHEDRYPSAVFRRAAADPDLYHLEFDVTFDTDSIPQGQVSQLAGAVLVNDEAIFASGVSTPQWACDNEGCPEGYNFESDGQTDETIRISVPFNEFPGTSPDSIWQLVSIGLSGNWGPEEATVYIDNLRLTSVVPGDFTDDLVLDESDIDLLSFVLRSREDPTLTQNLDARNLRYDLNGDGNVDSNDRLALVDNIMQTYLGDSNLDGEFNSSDLVRVFVHGEYEDEIRANSTWGTGDWNGDFEFDSTDFIAAFQVGAYERGPKLQ